METKHLYYDPFAEAGEQLFDPTQSFAALEKRYIESTIAHDSTADEFVRSTEAIMLDAVFLERFDAVQAIAARLHELCGEDHYLNQSVQANETVAGIIDTHSANDGQGHDAKSRNKSSLKKQEANKKNGKKKKSKYSGWLSLLNN